jgi:hypothetical protein
MDQNDCKAMHCQFPDRYTDPSLSMVAFHHLGSLSFWEVYSGALWGFLLHYTKRSLYHLTWPIWLVIEAAMEAYVPILKGVGISLIAYASFLTMY